jgi:hypothetical protein
MGDQMTKDDILNMAKECDLVAGNAEHGIYIMSLERFAALVAEKATEQANARQNASWALMCKKMVAAEREAIISRLLEIGALEDGAFIEAIRARGDK